MPATLRLPAPPSTDALERARALIIRGRIPPGVRVTEADLAARLGVGRTPAREAVQRLLAEGLLVPAGGGARPRAAVAPISAEDAEELFQAAGALEGIAVRSIGELSDAERRLLVRSLRERQRTLRQSARARPIDYDQLFEAHNAFHDTLRQACAGAGTHSLLETIRARLDRYEWLYAPLVGPDFSPTFAEHDAIIAAVSEGDGRACERAVRANWFNAGRRVARAVEGAGELGLARLAALATKM
ncbi:MAG TPA: GntR family transcriptional regulator [Gemmatimonadaceae bacterium]|nr:GntR family transcriptional regulator [Gemmatimonadaceae bacterium]